MAAEREWNGPLSPWITDGEKNEAINRIDRELAAWRARNSGAEAPAQPENEAKETRCPS